MASPATPPCPLCEAVRDRFSKERLALTRQLVAMEKKLLQPCPPEPQANTLLDSISVRMNEAQARHRLTLAELEARSSRVRHELTIKLSKTSDLVLSLNQENAKAKEQLKRAEDRIDVLTAERNYFVKESQVLAAEVLETGKLGVDAALQSRLELEMARSSELEDAVRKLSSRLRSSMDVIRELEKAPPPPTTSNFFGTPTARPPAPPASSSHSQMLVKTLSAQLTQQRIACKSALQQVEEVRKLGLAREERLLERIRELEEGIQLR
mmetsp:Transcript_22803/g.47294  ORF Transcript_22803/g.47294 Transcript_22803/m.47294 type:complete len:267 (-) Transcript_22803:3-803(-)